MTFDWPGIVEREGGALGDAAAKDPQAAVPAAPGWDTTELLRHIGMIHARTSIILRTGTTERPSRRNGMLPEAPADGVLEWYRTTLAELVADLRAIDDPDRPVWAFSPDHARAGFWPRRMAHETVVHRVDAEQALAGPVASIEPAFAVDGIDEVLRVFVPALGADRSPGDGRTVDLRPTEEADGWQIRFDPGQVTVETEGWDEGTADATVRGTAGDLLLWLWGRHPIEGLDVTGDRDAALALRAVTTF